MDRKELGGLGLRIRPSVNDIYYRCHNCGSVHEIEAIRQNLFYNGRPAGDIRAARRGGLPRPCGWPRRGITRALMRALWSR